MNSISKFRSFCKASRELTAKLDGRAHPSVIIKPPVYPNASPRTLVLHRIDPRNQTRTTVEVFVPKTILSEPINTGRHVSLLQGSCDGLLCFEEHRQQMLGPRLYHVFNLSKGEWMTVPIIEQEDPVRCYFRAIYYHQPMDEYRLLEYRKHIRPDSTSEIAYEVFSFKKTNKSWRRIDCLYHDDDPPQPLASRVEGQVLEGEEVDRCEVISACGSLHWAPRKKIYPWARKKVYPWILAFDVESEKFRQMCVPKREDKLPCLLNFEEYHLFKMEESLGLSRPTRTGQEMVIWFLNDYAKEEWIKLYTISKQSLERALGRELNSVRGLKPLILCNDGEILLLRWEEGVFLFYNLILQEFMEVKFESYGKVVPLIETLAGNNYITRSDA